MTGTTTCTAKNGTYCCTRPKGHGGMFHGTTVRKRRKGMTYESSALWTGPYAQVTFSVPVPVGVATATR